MAGYTPRQIEQLVTEAEHYINEPGPENEIELRRQEVQGILNDAITDLWLGEGITLEGTYLVANKNSEQPLAPITTLATSILNNWHSYGYSTADIKSDILDYATDNPNQSEQEAADFIRKTYENIGRYAVVHIVQDPSHFFKNSPDLLTANALYNRAKGPAATTTLTSRHHDTEVISQRDRFEEFERVLQARGYYDWERRLTPGWLQHLDCELYEERDILSSLVRIAPIFRNVTVDSKAMATALLNRISMIAESELHNNQYRFTSLALFLIETGGGYQLARRRQPTTMRLSSLVALQELRVRGELYSVAKGSYCLAVKGAFINNAGQADSRNIFIPLESLRAENFHAEAA